MATYDAIVGFEVGELMGQPTTVDLFTGFPSGTGILTPQSSSVSTTATIDSTIKKSGNSSFKVPLAASEVLYISIKGAAGQFATNIVGRFSFYLDAALGDTSIARSVTIGTIIGPTPSPEFVIDQAITTGALTIGCKYFSGTSPNNPTTSITTGQWYTIDFFCLVSVISPLSCQWAVNGITQTTATVTGTSGGGSSSFQAGRSRMTNIAAGNVNVYLDDIALSAQSGDYPLSFDTIIGAMPSSVSSHNLDASPSQFFFDTTGTAIQSTDTTTYQAIDDNPVNTVVGEDYVQEQALITYNTISRIGGVAAAATSVTVPAHAIGDLMLMWVWRNGSATAPTIPSGWTLINTTSQGGSTKLWAGLYYHVATATNDTSGTWTSATALCCEIYRNVGTLVAGNIPLTSGVSATQNYPAVTLQDTAHSWLATFGATTTSGGNVVPTGSGLTLRDSISATMQSSDSNGIRSTNWSSTNTTITSQGWATAVVELKASTNVTQPTTAYYLGYGFPALSGINPQAVAIIAPMKMIDTTLGNSSNATRLSDDGTTFSNVISFSNANYSARAWFTGVLNTKPSTGGAWDSAGISALKMRWGISNTVTGGLRLHAAGVEVIGTAVSGGGGDAVANIEGGGYYP